MINESILSKKGMMEAINMGILPKYADFTEILNNKFEIMREPPKTQENEEPQIPVDTFVTNPLIEETAE